mmetsp:Transcript_19245/g.41833  ORF Transcript_19245/g.41833 Transcript_19245/m.41833 type:complete len:242 (-) Transcript_19245:439-1164(-)
MAGIHTDSSIRSEEGENGRIREPSLEAEENDATDEEAGTKIGDTNIHARDRDSSRSSFFAHLRQCFRKPSEKRDNRSEQGRTNLSSGIDGLGTSRRGRKITRAYIAAIIVILSFATIGTALGVTLYLKNKTIDDGSSDGKVVEPTSDPTASLTTPSPTPPTSVPNATLPPEIGLNSDTDNPPNPTVLSRNITIMVVMEMTERRLTIAEIEAAQVDVLAKSRLGTDFGKTEKLSVIDEDKRI